MHQQIKNFYLSGTVAESKLVQTRATLDKECEDWMRDEGYAPALDLFKQFTTTYDPERQEYEFELTVYGAYVGKDEAWTISGVADGKTIKKYIAPTK